jgi:hypothetical protein
MSKMIPHRKYNDQNAWILMEVKTEAYENDAKLIKIKHIQQTQLIIDEIVTNKSPQEYIVYRFSNFKSIPVDDIVRGLIIPEYLRGEGRWNICSDWNTVLIVPWTTTDPERSLYMKYR